jgi:hypothetical protein
MYHVYSYVHYAEHVHLHVIETISWDLHLLFVAYDIMNSYAYCSNALNFSETKIELRSEPMCFSAGSPNFKVGQNMEQSVELTQNQCQEQR